MAFVFFSTACIKLFLKKTSKFEQVANVGGHLVQICGWALRFRMLKDLRKKQVGTS